LDKHLGGVHPTPFVDPDPARWYDGARLITRGQASFSAILIRIGVFSLRLRRLTSFAVLAALAFAVGAASAGTSPHSSPRATTLVTGTVLLDPARPVCQVGKPCSKPLVGFKLVFSRRGVRVGRAVTDRQGRYRISLPPGIYRVTTTAHRQAGRGLEPSRIYVPSRRLAIRNFTYDAGIR
jgi:hypothetical protein